MNNTHLCYVYIYEYKCLKDIELVIDCHYKYKFDKEKKNINITNNKDFPNKFWGESIYSITSLVGNNGTGKSTIMSFLLDFLVEGSASRSVNGIIIYEQNGTLFYYGKDISVIYEKITLWNDQINMNLNQLKWKIPCFYYSGHFSPYIKNDSRNNNLLGCHIASDNICLVEDLQNYYNEDSLEMQKPLKQHLYSYVAQNNYRICMMLANKTLSKIIKDFVWPRYVLIGINSSGSFAIENAIITENKIREKYGQEKIDVSIPSFKSLFKDTSSLDYFLSNLIYYNLINIIYDNWNWHNGFDIIDDWQNFKSPETSIMTRFLSFIETVLDEYKKNTLMSLYNMLMIVIKHTEYKPAEYGNGFLYIDCSEKSTSLTEIGEMVLNNNNFYLTSKFFDFYYAASLDEETHTILSSGEFELLNLFSRIYDATILKPSKFSNIESSCLIMLDEAEIGFHPKWQRKYLKLVIDFMNALKKMYSKIPDFQIIISTHSPILLSDIPKCCTNYLKQDLYNNTIKVPENEIGETFAANVFDLYRMSFFMEDGLVGEFARQKINELNERICNGETDGVMNEIRMIGDERIREYLIERYYDKHNENADIKKDLIAYYKEKIEKLEN